VDSTITLDEGETGVTCTINNDDIAPTLKLVKTVTNEDGGSKAPDDWTLSAGAPAPDNGRNFSNAGGSGVFETVFANAGYDLSETTAAGYTAGSWSCDGGGLVGSTITLDEGETGVTCTINNDDIAPTLKLVYLPTILHNYCDGFPGPTEQENNDKASQANGPLCFNRTYTGQPNSDLPGNEEDWFYVDWSGAGQIVVDVTNFPPGEFVVLYFNGSGGREELTFDDDPDSNGKYHVEHSGKGSGRYFIRLVAEEESRPSTNYSLLVTTR
jgi:hypothetical protein